MIQFIYINLIKCIILELLMNILFLLYFEK